VTSDEVGSTIRHRNKKQSMQWHHTKPPKRIKKGQNCTLAWQRYGNCLLEF